MCSDFYFLKMMKKIILYYLLIGIFCISNFAHAQELEANILQWLESNSLEKLKSHFEKISRKYPDSPITLFLEAYIEQDGERAVHLYEQFVDKHPKSKYTDRAILKIAQYYYAVGSYIAARQYLDNLIDQFPDSPCIPDAKYLSARCLIAMGYYSSAEKELKEFIKKYPNSQLKIHAQQELNQPRNQSPEEKSTSQKTTPENVYDQLIEATQKQGRYTIQIGAFGERDNALKQKELYVRKGYEASVATKYIGDRLLYLVWIGEFESEDQARKFGEKLKSKNDIAFQVVQK